MLRILIFMIHLLSQDKGILGLSKFSLYKQRTEQKKHPTTEATAEYTGPPFLDVTWNGHPNLPEEINNADILKEILEKVAEYKRYEYCPFGKQMDDCTSKSVNEIVDQIIDVVLHPTEPPTEPPTQPPVISEAPEEHEPEAENEEIDDEEEKENEEPEEEGETAGTTETVEKSEETSINEEASEGSEGEATEAPPPAEEPAEE